MTPTSYISSILNDPEWFFLGEYTLGELIADTNYQSEFAAGSDGHIIGGLGIPAECYNNIQRTLTRFAQDEMAALEQGRSELPVYVRAFCPKKIVEDVNSHKFSSQFIAQQQLKPMNIFHHSDADINGGWGFFLVDRIGSSTPNSTSSTYQLVDLYLYKEGE